MVLENPTCHDQPTTAFGEQLCKLKLRKPRSCSRIEPKELIRYKASDFRPLVGWDGSKNIIATCSHC